MASETRFTDNGDGTVTDTGTSLMWTRTDSMNDLEKWVNYPDSADYVRHLNEKKFAGYEDWRLPIREEMATIFDPSSNVKDKFGKDVHISDCFSPGGGFSMIAQQVSGRQRTWVLNIRTGEDNQPDGLWTISEAARAVRTLPPGNSD